MINGAADRLLKGQALALAALLVVVFIVTSLMFTSAKGGIVALTLPVARELARSGIRCVTIAPGIMETPMLLGMAPEVQESLGKMVPFPSRMGKPSEFAGLVRHIAENAYLNGEVIRLDGAIRMGVK